MLDKLAQNIAIRAPVVSRGLDGMSFGHLTAAALSLSTR